MTVYVEYLPQQTTTATRSLLWADSPAEMRRFAAALEVACVPWLQTTTISERQRRRAILMGAIPVDTNAPQPDPRSTFSGVGA